MKGFFEWFKSNTKIKRWIFLILIGIILLCYAISNIIVTEELSFSQIGKIAVSFVIGFLCTIIGIIYIQKRTLEILVEDTNNHNNENVKSLIFNKKIYNQGPKVVVLGGGSGLNSILKGLKNYTDNITAIVTVSDCGENLSDSRNVLSNLSLEELKSGIISLAKDENTMNKLMNVKFQDGLLNSLSFGDIFLLTMNELNDDFTKSIEKTKDILNITGKVLPSTLEKIKICTELEDGTVIDNKRNIKDVVNSKISKISRVFIQPYHCRPAPGVLEAIQEADAICFAPGSLYTNIIPNLLIKGISKEIKESKAFKVYISNLMTEPGQTDNYTLSDHIEAINAHAGNKVIDYCIYDTTEIVPEYIRKYNMEGYELVEQDIQKVKNMGIKVIQRQVSCIEQGYIRHDSQVTAQTIIELICEDLKFKDKQNDFKYMLVNDRLKNNKKVNKRNKNKKPAKKQNDTVKGKSKFFKKYQARIESIQESDIKLKEKEKLKEREKIIKMQEKLKKKTSRENVSKTINNKLKEKESLKRNTENQAPKRTNVKKNINDGLKEKESVKKRVKTQSELQDNIMMNTPNRIERLDDEERKKIIDTINKLRR